MNDSIERLLVAATAYQPAWDGDLDRLVRRAQVRRMKVAAMAASVTTAIAVAVAVPAMSDPRRLGATAERSGLEQRPDQPARPAPDGTAEAPDTGSGTTPDPAAGTAPGRAVSGQPGGPGDRLPGLPAAPVESPAPEPTTRAPGPGGDPGSPSGQPAPRHWSERYDSPAEAGGGVYADDTFGPADYYERRYVAGDAAKYCTHPPQQNPVEPILRGEQPLCVNFWYGIGKDRDTMLVLKSACVPADFETATYTFAEGQETDVFLWDTTTDGTLEPGNAVYRWSKHVAPLPAHSVTVERGDCVHYTWHVKLRDDAGNKLDKSKRYVPGGVVYGRTTESSESRFGWYGEEFQP